MRDDIKFSNDGEGYGGNCITTVFSEENYKKELTANYNKIPLKMICILSPCLSLQRCSAFLMQLRNRKDKLLLHE